MDLGSDGDLRLDSVPALWERIHERLEGLVLSGQLEPGARLIEADIAKRFGVSRGPVREALQALHRDGFVDLQPRQAAFVHRPQIREMEDVFDMRSVLEGEAARLAAVRIRPESAEKLSRLVEEGSAAVEAGKPAPEGKAFHDLIVASAESHLLAEYLSSLSKKIKWYSLWFDPVHRDIAWGDHEVIARSIAEGDEVGAQESARLHVERSRSHFREQFAAGEIPAQPATDVPRSG